MVRPPSHIFIVRHGNRLDAADKQWHLTSPTPYDTPLTYSGFLQARQVGNHISSLLEKAKADAEVSRDGAVISGKPRRFRIVIHSSPFLRCVQTSIGIASGLAQTPQGSVHEPSDLIVPRSPPSGQPCRFKSALLRIDPFLGEWLTSEYFECITPPPGSALMVGSAKAELLRRDDYSMYADRTTTTTNTTNNSNTSNLHRSTPSTSSLWNGSVITSPLDTGLASPGAGDPVSVMPTNTAPQAASRRRQEYVAPRPMYAVSNGGGIPEGLVAHARDACVMADYQWDSMRSPLEFGDGGVFGEEWAAMHRRFRWGVKKLVNWYATADKPSELQPVQDRTENAPGEHDYVCEQGVEDRDGDQDEDVDTVIVIVSHGAGCNALIGAVTHQPVLIDVGIASITMAVRRQDLDYSHARALAQTRPQDQDQDAGAAPRLVPVDQMYDIRISATTEHLRPGTSASASGRSPSVSSVWSPTSPSARRGRTTTVGSSMGGPVLSPFIYRESAPLIDSSPGMTANVPADNSEPDVGRDLGDAVRMLRLDTDHSSPSSGNDLWSSGTSSPGLWAPVASSLRFMDDSDTDGTVDDYDSFLPDFDNKRFMKPVADKEEEVMKRKTKQMEMENVGKMERLTRDFSLAAEEESTESFPHFPPAVQAPPVKVSSDFVGRTERPVFSAPIKLNNHHELRSLAVETGYGEWDDGPAFGGVWGSSSSALASEAEQYHDLGYSKQYWSR